MLLIQNLLIGILSLLLVVGSITIINQRQIIKSLKSGLKVIISASLLKDLEEAMKSEKPNGEKK
jgi:hypothetical protein